jgi:hypothetical protein
MPRYFVEQHWDGDFVTTDSRTVIADDEDAAKLIAAEGLARDTDRLEFDDEDEHLENPLTPDGYESVEDFLNDLVYLDSITELPESHPTGRNPIEHLLDCVSELLDNRQHLDLHEDDRKMLADAHLAADRLQQSREEHFG